MSKIISITGSEKQELLGLRDKFESKVKVAGCSTLAASFFGAGGIIVIMCSCLCLTLPGVNVINHVILPAVIPGTIVMVTIVPLLIASVIYHNKEKNRIREKMIRKMINHLHIYKIPEETRKVRVKFILHNFLEWKVHPTQPHKLLRNRLWTVEYQGKLLSELKDTLGKEKTDRNPRQERIARALDAARAKIPEKVSIYD